MLFSYSHNSVPMIIGGEMAVVWMYVCVCVCVLVVDVRQLFKDMIPGWIEDRMSDLGTSCECWFSGVVRKNCVMRTQPIPGDNKYFGDRRVCFIVCLSFIFECMCLCFVCVLFCVLRLYRNYYNYVWFVCLKASGCCLFDYLISIDFSHFLSICSLFVCSLFFSSLALARIEFSI